MAPFNFANLFPIFATHEVNSSVPTTNVLFYPVVDGHSKVHFYFSQYGEIIKPISYGTICGVKCGSLVYEKAKSASEVIRVRDHKIDKKFVTATAVPSWLPKPTISCSVLKAASTDATNAPDHDSPLNILNKLNDDCLMKIFARLSLGDVCAVSQVCSAFKCIAKNIFSSGFGDVKMHNLRNLKQNEILFRNFGSVIKSIELSFGYWGDKFDKRIIELMAMYCVSDSALKELSIDNLIVHFPQQLKMIFSRMKTLSISRGWDNESLSICTELKNFKISSVDFTVGDNTLQRFEKLEKIEFKDVGLTDQILERFILSHPQLETLMVDETGNKLSSNIYHIIGSNLPLLENLELQNQLVLHRDADRSLNQLANMKNLKVLHLYCSSNTQTPGLLQALAKEHIPIEKLHLIHFTLDSNDCDNLMMLDKLKELYFEYGEMKVKSSQLVTALKALPHLSQIIFVAFGRLSIIDIKELLQTASKLEHVELTDQRKLEIDENNFKSILNLIKKRLNKIKLTMVIMGCHCELDVPKDVIEQNLQWLDIVSEDTCENSTGDSDSSN